MYAATHRNKKRVAIKMLHAELSQDEAIRKRFLREAFVRNVVIVDGDGSPLTDGIRLLDNSNSLRF